MRTVFRAMASAASGAALIGGVLLTGPAAHASDSSVNIHDHTLTVKKTANLRSSSNSDSRSLGTLFKGTRVRAERTAHNGKWDKVTVLSGHGKNRKGWVSGELLQMDYPCLPHECPPFPS
jgi:uncharacterized protein YgiM (DUF1202 family)